MRNRWLSKVSAIILAFGCMVLMCGTVKASYFDDAMAVLRNLVSSRQNFIVNGVPVKMTAINSEGYNYIRLGELAKHLDIDAFCDAPWIQLDKTKPFSGVRVLKAASKVERDAAMIVFGEKEVMPGFDLDSVFTDNLGNIRPWLKYYSGYDLSPVKIDGYIYVQLLSVAGTLDISVQYDIATNTVILDKTKPMEYPYTVANGGLVCPVWDYGNWYSIAGALYYSGEPGAYDYGLSVEARFETYPDGNICRTTDYRISKDFLTQDITISSGGVDFFFHYEGDEGLTDPPGFSEWAAPDADRGPFLNALQKVLNFDLEEGRGVEDTPENRKAQSKLFRVFINGEQITGTILHRWTSTASPGGERYYFAFDKVYELREIQTVRVELDGSGVQ